MSRSFKVLIVGGENSRVGMYKAMSVWSENGFEIAGSASGIKEALRLSEKYSADLLICFSKPPIINAPELLKELKRFGSAAPVIVISPDRGAETMRECFLMGAIDYLTEPVTEAALSGSLERAKEHMKKTDSDHDYYIVVEEYFTELSQRVPNDKFITELKHFILECENMTATTEYAADHFGFNKDYFGRMFKAKIGMTFGEFYKRFRIKYAERLLLSGRYKVYEVSEMLGFASADYFTSIFKQITGKRPSDLKKY